MGRYDEKISDNSEWITATPSPTAAVLPFYVTESGHFYAERDYKVEREKHDSFLIMYTLAGCGEVISGDTIIRLTKGCAVMIDCHKPHRYCADGGAWEFIWLHINGSVETFFKLLYPKSVFAVRLYEPDAFSAALSAVIAEARQNDMTHAIDMSARLHGILNTLIKSSLETDVKRNLGKYFDTVQSAAELIRERYSEQISIDDIIEDIPMSKFYFIRVFRRIMGTTPYNYLMNYRINTAKITLRTSDTPINEISLQCGFLDTANFITHFKKYTGQTPSQYRQYFLAD